MLFLELLLQGIAFRLLTGWRVLVLRCCPQIQKERRAKRILQRQAERQSHSIVLGGRKKVKEFCYDLSVQREKVIISYCRYHAYPRCLLSSMVSSGYVGCVCP
jgi:hypothetical protein